MYVIAGGAVLGTLATRFTEPGPMVVAVVALGIGLALHYWARGIKHTVFNIFDREAGTVRFPKGVFFSDEVTEGPWEEWGGRLWIMSSRTGIPRHVLSLVHFPTYRVFMVDSDITGIDRLLGFWSFLVQYMDKDAPLPDAPGLEKYPNRTQGIGTWKEWMDLGGRLPGPDPYREWLAELKANPALDVYNTDVLRGRPG